MPEPTSFTCRQVGVLHRPIERELPTRPPRRRPNRRLTELGPELSKGARTPMGDRTQKLVLNQLKLMLHVLFHVVAPNRNVLC